MEYEYRNILKEPPNLEELEQLAQLGEMEVSSLLNPRSRAFKNTGLNKKEVTSLQAGELIHQNPRMMYRPLLTNGQEIVVGFNPKEIEKIL